MTVMKEEKKQEEEKLIWTKEEREKLSEKYGTSIIIENGTYEDVRTTQAPNDAYIVKYVHEGSVRYDLTRGTKMSLFDMYYDKVKQGLRSIDYGKGNIKPYLWGYKSPQGKKKKK